MLFTPENYAKHRNCDPRLVTEGIQRRRLVLVNGLIESEIADKIWSPGDMPIGETRGDKTPHADGTRTLLAVKTEHARIRITREEFQVKRAELEYEQRVGRLVDKQQVEQQIFEDFRAVRDGFLNIPERLAGVLAAETDESVVYQTLRSEIEHVLANFADRERAKVA